MSGDDDLLAPRHKSQQAKTTAGHQIKTVIGNGTGCTALKSFGDNVVIIALYLAFHSSPLALPARAFLSAGF